MSQIEFIEKIDPDEEVTQKSEVEEIIVNEDSSSIDILNDDTLMLIFEMLSFADKIKIERVCKRWQAIAKHSWHATKHIDLKNKTWGLRNRRPIAVLNKTILTKIGKLCGKYLTSVSLNFFEFREICRSSKRIEELHLMDYRHGCEFNKLPRVALCRCRPAAWLDILKNIMPKISHNLKIFSLELNHPYYKEVDIANLIARLVNTEIISLTFRTLIKFKGIYLNSLPFNTLQEITLTDLHHVNNWLISSTINRCQNLRKIHLSDLRALHHDLIFEAISSHALTLKNLFLHTAVYLQNIRDMHRPLILKSMATLKVLEYFTICWFGIVVSDEFVQVVSQHCLELRHLGLCGGTRLTDEGVSSISNLKKLRFLEISFLSQIKHLPLEEPNTLESLQIDNSYGFGYETLSAFMKNARCLRNIYMRGCSYIYRDMVRALSDINHEVRTSYITVHADPDFQTFLQNSTSCVLPSFMRVITYDTNIIRVERFSRHHYFSAIMVERPRYDI